MHLVRFPSTLFTVMAVSVAAVLASPVAGAQPAPDPCAQSVLLLCRILPIYPGLEEDVDLTKPTPAEAPLGPAVEPAPIAPGANTE